MSRGEAVPCPGQGGGKDSTGRGAQGFSELMTVTVSDRGIKKNKSAWDFHTVEQETEERGTETSHQWPEENPVLTSSRCPSGCLGDSGWQPERARHAGRSPGGRNPAVWSGVHS